MTNSSQAVTASLTLSAFGQTVASTGSSTSAYQFGATSGYRSEGDVGLTLVGCRFYDAQVGRFISRDTYLDQAPYAYCDGDPVNATDPTGHYGWWGVVNDVNVTIFGAIGATIGGGLGIPEVPITAGISLPTGVIIGGGVGAGAGHFLTSGEEAVYDYFKDLPAPTGPPPTNGRIPYPHDYEGAPLLQ